MSTQFLSALSGERKFKYCVMDIEAAEWTKVRYVGFFDGEQFLYFRTVKQFLEHFLQQKYAYWRCFAHYGAGYDFNFILDAFDEHFPDMKLEILSQNGASYIKVLDGESSKGRAWHFLDSFRLLPKSLYDLTHSFDVEHKKLKNVDIANIDEQDQKEVIKYLEHDCRGLYEVIQKFESWFARWKVPLKATIASQSMAAYRRTMKESIPVLKESVENFIRDGYYGGRTEVFKLRCFDKIHMYDVKSLYPSVMVKYPMPVGTPIRVAKFIPDKIGFYKCRIQIPDMYLPPLPIQYNHKLVFPVGQFHGTYSSKEIEVAQELGCIVTIEDGYIFDSDFIFDEYVGEMYKLKESSDGTTKLIAKLLLNSLYGKFAQNRNKQIMVKTHDVKEIFGQNLAPYMEEKGLWTKQTVSHANFIIPSIASWITSCARYELFKWLQKSGQEHVFYCDTDSIASTKKLPTGDKLGELKHEYTGSEAIFLLPKMYAIKTDDKLIVKAKGFEQEFTKKLDFQAFDNALHGNRKDFVQSLQRFGKFKETLKRQHEFVSMLQKRKSIKTAYTKRIVLPNLDTKPLTVMR